MIPSDGGPVHPVSDSNTRDGMSLRDLFACHAMASILNHPPPEYVYREIAQWAYQMADAMLKERSKEC